MTLPAYLQNMPAADDRVESVLGNLGTIPQPYLSIAGGRFTLIDIAGGTVPIPKLEVDCVIIDCNPHKSKVFFGLNKPYDPDNPTPPICWSDNGIAPSIGASQPQHPTCQGCPHDVWGSRISQLGSSVKQCGDQQKIAIYIPEYSANGLWLLRIPPGSFGNFKNYMLKFQKAGMRPANVFTRIGFEPGVIGILTFSSPGFIPEAVAPTVIHMVTSHAADAMVGMLDKPRDPSQGTAATVAVAAPSSTTSGASALSAPIAVTANIDARANVKRRGPRRQVENPSPPAGAPFRPTEAPQFGIDSNAPAPPQGLQEQLNKVFE